MEPEKDPKVDAPAPQKPGFKTTEFWLSTFAAVVGALLSSGLLPEQGQAMKIVGVCALVLSVLGYTVQRSSVKKVMVIFAMIFLPLFVGGCSKGTIRADAVGGLIDDVTIRHDKLIRGELKLESISEADRATYLRSSEILRRTVKEARSP